MTKRVDTNQDDNPWSDRQDQRQDKQDVILAVIRNDIDYMKRDISFIKSQLASNYVTREEFYPIKKAFYYVIGIVVTLLVGSIMALVVKR